MLYIAQVYIFLIGSRVTIIHSIRINEWCPSMVVTVTILVSVFKIPDGIVLLWNAGHLISFENNSKANQYLLKNTYEALWEPLFFSLTSDPWPATQWKVWWLQILWSMLTGFSPGKWPAKILGLMWHLQKVFKHTGLHPVFACQSPSC